MKQKFYYLTSFFFLFFSVISQAELKSSYKEIDGKIAFQKYSNHDPIILNGATLDNFSIKYANDYINIAGSSPNWYCNGIALDDGFDPDAATALESFLISDTGSYAMCESLSVDIDKNSFTALNFPFFKDDNHVFTIKGNIVEDADSASFVSGRNQGFDKNNYFFVEANTVVLPYQDSVELYECFGWAKIDGSIHYKGKKREEIDVNSYKCLNFSNAIDKNNFYNFGAKSASFKQPIATENIKLLSDNFITDGTKIWYLHIEAFAIEGLDLSSVEIDGRTISDGKQSWQCESALQEGVPLCKKAN